MEKKKRGIWTTLANGTQVGSFGLTQELHDIVVSMVEKGIWKQDHYILEDNPDEWVEICIEDKHKGWKFLRDARNDDAWLYILKDDIGTWQQELGDVAIIEQY